MERYRLLSSTETYDEKQQQALSHCDHLIRDFAKRADRHKQSATKDSKGSALIDGYLPYN
jgi:uncharacterized Zn ribbon protein